MSNIKIPRKIFEKEIGKASEEMLNKIALFGCTVESITQEEIELEIFPDRPDMLSYQGFKRSFLAFLDKKPGIKEYKINAPEKDYKVIIDSSVKDIRPYTACAIIKGLKLNDEKIKELIDIQEKLHTTVGRKRKKLAIGIYPLEKITLPITLKALEPDQIKFIPLESDKEMSGLQILQRHPAGRDYAHLLSGKSKFPIFVDAKNQILSMPPIINSELTGRITQKTKEVFVECSGFDFNILKKCLNIIVSTFADMGGRIYSMEMKNAPEKISPNFEHEKNKISLENVNKLLGLELSEKELKKNLEKMGHKYEKGQVESPAYRVDLLHEVDLIEDVAIAYGYENFKPLIPEISTIGQIDPKEIIKRKISDILSGLGMIETSNYHLTTKKNQFTKMGIVDNKIKNVVEIEESKTENNIMRKDLSHYAMKILSENVDASYPQNIFETGRIFIDKKEEVEEKEMLCIAMAPGNFTELKQALGYLGRMLGLEITLKESTSAPESFIDGRVAEIMSEDKSLGYLGEIHPRIIKNWKVKMPVTLLEIDLDLIFEKLI